MKESSFRSSTHGYWDPLPTARRLIAEQPSLGHFEGLWRERNWRNVPGPFYGAHTDTLEMGRQDAPFHIAYDDDGREFVYRQPTDPAQVRDLLNGCVIGHGGHAMDGDDHWTVPGVREWWHDRSRVRQWAATTSDELARVGGRYREHYRDAAQGLRDYIAHLDGGLAEYLRGYLFWLAERRPPRPGEALPDLVLPHRRAAVPPATAAAPAVPAGGDPLLAGYFVTAPEPLTGLDVPHERLTTACDCLLDRLPVDGCWFDTPQEALDACATVRLPAGARLFALLVPPEHAGGLVSAIRASAVFEPVLLAHLDRPAGSGPAAEVAAGGRRIGWEVLGHDDGILHSWLCNDLYQDAVRDLGVTTDERGLLPSREPAERLAAWANARDDTKPVTWFPAALVEWDTPIESRFVPIVPAPPVPTPIRWWERFLEL
ncbi:hypothetical protein ACFVVU_15870 [Kitasatospora sp. NPDC057965]|uniref:hypothetical protein n=1 Tax=Kitasatospora sp. NPDC057965 TaxID=3346291 RepID=UPI0036DE4645